MSHNAAKKSAEAKSQIELSPAEKSLLDKMKSRATKAVASMPPVMVIW